MKLEKIRKTLAESVLEEMDAMGEAQLEKAITQAEQAIVQATQERNDNPKYQQAKQAVSDLSSALRDVKTYQTAKIQYALLRLQELGKSE